MTLLVLAACRGTGTVSLDAVPQAPGLHWHLADVLARQGQSDQAVDMLAMDDRGFITETTVWATNPR